MTDVAIREEAPTPVPMPQAPMSGTLADWAQEARAAAAIAKSLCNTSFVPRHFFNKPEETAAAILTGFELGMSPVAAIRAIFIISGTPAMYAKSMVAVAQSRGHKVWVAEQSSARVVVKGTRKGEPEVYETVWDLDRVKTADLTGNAMYRKNPQAMMVARGQAEIARQVAADALHGIPYAVEEVEDFEPRSEIVKAPKLTAAAIMPAPPAKEADDAEVIEDGDEDWPPVAPIPGGE